MKIPPGRDGGRSAYTLIEALVASSILLVGIGAACSMSLTLVTQEEINERSVRAVNYLDNAVRLYQMGVETADIGAILPPEPAVDSIGFSTRTVNVTGIGNIPATTITVTWTPAEGAGAGTPGGPEWTGGDPDVTRTISVEAIRSGSHLTGILPRLDYFN